MRTLLLLGSILVNLVCFGSRLLASEAQYPMVEIAPFEVPPGVDLPADFKLALQKNLVERLIETGRFGPVFLSSDVPKEGPQPSFRLNLSITSFKKGSRTERYLIGPGFGRTLLQAHIQFIDLVSGQVKFAKDVHGQVVIGGDSKGATDGLAKEVAKLVKKQM